MNRIRISKNVQPFVIFLQFSAISVKLNVLTSKPAFQRTCTQLPWRQKRETSTQRSFLLSLSSSYSASEVALPALRTLLRNWLRRV